MTQEMQQIVNLIEDNGLQEHLDKGVLETQIKRDEALETIAKKEVNIFLVKHSVCVETYNNGHLQEWQIAQEQYDLIKEAIKSYE